MSLKYESMWTCIWDHCESLARCAAQWSSPQKNTCSQFFHDSKQLSYIDMYIVRCVDFLYNSFFFSLFCTCERWITLPNLAILLTMVGFIYNFLFCLLFTGSIEESIQSTTFFPKPWQTSFSNFFCRFIGSSTCPLTGLFWLLSHAIFLKMTKVLYECLLSQAEWWVAELLFLSLNNWCLIFLQNECSQSSQIPLMRKTEKNWGKYLLFNLANFWLIKLNKTSILPNCQVPNGFFRYN